VLFRSPQNPKTPLLLSKEELLELVFSAKMGNKQEVAESKLNTQSTMRIS